LGKGEERKKDRRGEEWTGKVYASRAHLAKDADALVRASSFPMQPQEERVKGCIEEGRKWSVMTPAILQLQLLPILKDRMTLVRVTLGHVHHYFPQLEVPRLGAHSV
jgi:hypothetical protein